MTNKAASAKNYRDALAHDIKVIRETAEISDEIKKALSTDGLSLIQKTRLKKVQKELWSKLNMAKETKEYQEAKETKKQSKELVKKIMELTGKSKDEVEEIVYGQSKKSETKEQEKKVPQFEDKNHREESDETWKIKTEKANIWNEKQEEYEKKKVEVRINPEGDIKEYVSGVPQHLIGEQLFSKKALSRLGLLNRLPANMGVIQEMTGSKPGETNNEKYADFYEKNIKNRLAGFWDPPYEQFNTVDKWMCCWLADGDYAYFGKGTWSWLTAHGDCFFSVRLLKN